MKRTICFLLSFALFFPLCSCGFGKSSNADTVTFYYRRAEFSYGTQDSVISSEVRDISGHNGDLPYLLALYLMGPMSEDLLSPFPKNTRLISVENQDGTVRVELSVIRDSLSDSEFSLACACLTMTCLDLTGAEEVTVVSGERCVTMNQANLLLTDDITTEETTLGG